MCGPLQRHPSVVPRALPVLHWDERRTARQRLWRACVRTRQSRRLWERREGDAGAQGRGCSAAPVDTENAFVYGMQGRFSALSLYSVHAHAQSVLHSVGVHTLELTRCSRCRCCLLALQGLPAGGCIDACVGGEAHERHAVAEPPQRASTAPKGRRRLHVRIHPHGTPYAAPVSHHAL